MVVVVIIGVCGSGKTTSGSQLSAKLNWPFEDADDHHPPENISKMSRNIPLTDEDRWPWLYALHRIIAGWIAADKNGIISCSGLKKSYRDVLVGGEDGYKPQGECVLVFLKGSMDLIADRMAGRDDHFMPMSLLKSQFESLELPTQNETCITCDIEQSTEDIVTFILQQLRHYGYAST